MIVLLEPLSHQSTDADGSVVPTKMIKEANNIVKGASESRIAGESQSQRIKEANSFAKGASKSSIAGETQSQKKAIVNKRTIKEANSFAKGSSE